MKNIRGREMPKKCETCGFFTPYGSAGRCRREPGAVVFVRPGDGCEEWEHISIRDFEMQAEGKE